MEKSQDIYSKLLEVQRELDPIKKSEINPHFKSSYFDINSLLSSLKPVLSEAGILLLQPIERIEGKMCITTILRSVDDGSEIKGCMDLPALTDCQKMGGAITYYRRYSLQSLLGLEAEDDDGNTASEPWTNMQARSPAAQPPSATAKSKTCPDCGTIAYEKKGQYGPYYRCQPCNQYIK